MTDWWRAVERELDRLGEDAPDPWADLPIGGPPLTDEQLASLERQASIADALADADDFLDADDE
jgi:hypothetical protein